MSLRAAELFSLEGRVAVVTGAGGFLGRTLCRALLDNGASVVALGRGESVEEAVAGWRSEYGEARADARRIDMYELPELERLLGELADEGVDVLVNNAHEMGPATGFKVPEGRLEGAPADQWLRNLTGGVVWPGLATQRLGPAMRRRGHAAIVNVASMYALVAPDPRLYEGTEFGNPPGYSAAKAGMLALTRYTAAMWGREGVRANAIVPGPFSNVEDEGPNSVPPNDPFLRRLEERTALGRTGRPSELAGALVFLASDASSYVTGHALVVDGGWTIT